jgi:hypothetical protein
MTYLEFSTIEKFNTFEKQYSFDALKYYLANSSNSDGNAWDIIDLVKIPMGNITISNFDPNRTPVLGTNKSTKVLEKEKQGTIYSHEVKQATNGKYYCLKREDITVPEKYDDNNNLVHPQFTVPFGSSFYNNVTWDSETEIEPDWE